MFSHGGRKATGLDAVEWAKRAVALGAGEIVLNTIDADGTKAGFDLVITRRISEAVGVPVVASGGAGTLEHMAEVLLEGKADAVLAASIFHFGDLHRRRREAIPQQQGHRCQADLTGARSLEGLKRSRVEALKRRSAQRHRSNA